MSELITDKHFADWEADVFGFGYGTGEAFTLSALKDFFAAVEPNEHGGVSYDYRRLEAALGGTVAWLLINALCHADIIEYGTSPRFGWLTPAGEKLREYLASKTADELYAVIDRDPMDTCLRSHCNCPPDSPCDNPLFAR